MPFSQPFMVTSLIANKEAAKSESRKTRAFTFKLLEWLERIHSDFKRKRALSLFKKHESTISYAEYFVSVMSSRFAEANCCLEKGDKPLWTKETMVSLASRINEVRELSKKYRKRFEKDMKKASILGDQVADLKLRYHKTLEGMKVLKKDAVALLDSYK